MKKKVVYIGCFVLTLLLAINISLLIHLNSSSVRIRNQLELAQKYLIDMDYDEAIAAFEAVIGIEPKNVEAWLGIVDAYICKGDYDKALKYAKKGYEATDDEQLLEKIEMIESGNITDYLGKIRKRTGYDSEHNIIWWQEFTYSRNGKIDTATSYDVNGNITGQVICEFNERGNIITGYSSSFERGTIYKLGYEYDDQDRMIKEIRYNSKGEIGSYWLKEYDDNGNDIKSVLYDGGDGDDFTVSMICYREHDKDHHPIKDTICRSDGTVQTYITYEYNDKQKLIKESYYNADNVLSEYMVYSYDDTGKCIASQNYNGEGILQYEQSGSK